MRLKLEILLSFLLDFNANGNSPKVLKNIIDWSAKRKKKDFLGNFDKCFFNEIGVLKYFVIKKSLKIEKSKN